MSLLEELAERLPTETVIDYAPGASGAAEPTALLALAFVVAGLEDRAAQSADWLADAQHQNGAVPVRPSEEWPLWPTGLASLAWHAVAKDRYAERIEQALSWTLQFESKKMEPDSDVGHDVTIIAWPWVEGTHCWIEPTVFHLLSLRAAGKEDHIRYLDGIRVLLNRQLPSGGCNYGNTTVLGQLLRPHLLPSAMALLALQGEPREPAISRSVGYLRKALREPQTLISHAWALQAAAAFDETPIGVESALRKHLERVDAEGGNPYHVALLTLAAAGERSPLVKLVRDGVVR